MKQFVVLALRGCRSKRRPLIVVEMHLRSYARRDRHDKGYWVNRSLATKCLDKKRRPVSDRIGLPYLVRQKQVADIYHTTGFTKAKLAGLRDKLPPTG